MDEDDNHNNNNIANPNSKIQQSKACYLSSINVYIYIMWQNFYILLYRYIVCTLYIWWYTFRIIIIDDGLILIIV